MLGAIYGDKAGSIYEFEQLKKVRGITTSDLIKEESFFSDDTILTISIMDSILNNKDYEKNLRKYILDFLDYKPNFEPYFKHPFSPHTIKWACGTGKSNSAGNGALMRISPVGYLFDTIDDVQENAYLATIPSHNSEEAIDGAMKLASLIFYFRNGIEKEKAFKMLNLSPIYKPFEKFNVTTSETLGNCLYALYNSNSFEDAIRKTLLMGGDTDTNAAIVGSMAEALYGMSEKEKYDAMDKLPGDFVRVLKKYY